MIFQAHIPRTPPNESIELHDWGTYGEWLLFDSRDPNSGRYDVFLMNYSRKNIRNLTAGSPQKYHQTPAFIYFN